MYIYSKPTIISTSVEQISKGIRASACSNLWQCVGSTCAFEGSYCGDKPMFSGGGCSSWDIDICDPFNDAGVGHGTYPPMDSELTM